MDPVEKLNIVKDSQLASGEARKAVKYADGVLPGQGSPEQEDTNDQAIKPVPIQIQNSPAVVKRKKYKKIKVMFITQHVGDTESEDESPPPPPPGSPVRLSYREFVEKYGRSVEAKA